MIKVRVEGLAATQRDIERLKRELGLSSAEFADLAAGVVRDTVVRNAQPFGNTKKAMEQGRGAIRKDLSKIFKIVPEAARGRRGVIASIAAAKRFHDSRRNSKGRTSRGQQAEIIPSIYRMYSDQVSERVGMAKGSLAGGGDSRFKGRVVGWVARWKGKGDALRTRSIFGAVWRFSAEPRHVASGSVMGARGVERVFRKEKANLLRVLKRKKTRLLKTAERRVNR
jgi:hypothetical protein